MSLNSDPSYPPEEQLVDQAYFESIKEAIRLRKEGDHVAWETKRLRTEFDETEALSKRLRKELDETEAQSKRLRTELDESEAQSKRLKLSQSEATSLTETLGFEGMCMGLVQNVVQIQTKGKHETGYQYLVGRGYVFPVRHCYGFPVGHGRQLGQALRNNTHLSELQLCIDRLLPVVDDSGKKFCESQVPAFVQPLNQFIRSSTAMRRLELTEKQDNEGFSKTLVGELLTASCENRNLDEVCFNIRVPTHPFQRFMASTTVSRIVMYDLDGYHFVYTPEERQVLATAFTLNTSLKFLKIGFHDELATMAVLDALCLGHGCLSELKLCTYYKDRSIEFWQTLSKYLHSTKLLEHLHLDCVEFDASAMGELINGLIHRNFDGARPLVSIAKLTFYACMFSSGAQDALQTFMQTKTESKDGTNNPVISNLTEMVFDHDSFDDYEALPKLAFMLLTQQDGKDQSNEIKWSLTIGSQLQVLSIHAVSCFGRLRFLRRLARHAHRVSLASLHINQLYDEDGNEVMEMSNAITKIPSLRHLSIGLSGVKMHPILHSLKKNGTIQSVSIPGKVQSRLAGAYCQRNIHLGELLQRRSSTGNADLDRKDGTAMPQPAKATADMLCPALFQAAEQISLTRASMVLAGLMNMRESIGKRD